MPRAALLVAFCLAAATGLSAGPSEREVADWAIRVGGRVTLEGQAIAITDPTQLPAGEVRITGLDLTNTLIDPTDLRRLTGLTSLRELYLPGPSWNPASGSRLDANDELKNLAGLVNLERIYFSLHFLPNVNVRDKGIAYWSGLTRLRELRLTQCRVEAPNLAPFKDLESLDLSYTTFNDAGMKALEGLHKLRRLNLRDTLISDEGLRSIANLTNLEEIDLYGAKVTDTGIGTLRKLTALRKLNLLGADVGDESADVLAGFTHLRELNLYRSRMTNSGLAKLSGLKEMVALDVRYSRVTGSGVDGLRAALPKCQVDFVGAVASSGSRPAQLQGSGDQAVADWVRKAGGKAQMSEGKLKAISMRSAHVGDAQLANLRGLTELQSLDLSATEIGDTGLSSLKTLGSLRELILNNTTVSDTGLQQLAELHGLRRFGLVGTLVKGEGFRNLKLPALADLDLTSSPVSDDGLKYVVALGSRRTPVGQPIRT